MSDQSLRQRRLTEDRAAFPETLAQYAKELGFTRASGSKWKKQGLIVFVPDDEGKRADGLIDAAASDQRRDAAQNPGQRQAPIDASADDQPDLIEESPSRRQDGTQSAFSRAKAGSAVLDLKLKRLQFDERVGNLVPVAEVEAREASRAGRLQEALLRIAVDAAPAANPDDPKRAQRAFLEELRRAIKRFVTSEEASLRDEEAADQTAETEALAHAG